MKLTEIDVLYKSYGASTKEQCPINTELNKGELYNQLHSNRSAFTKNSVFSYSACGASSVGLDWLKQNGFKI